MIEKNNIITLAWLKLGEQNQLYNNNITDRMTIASTLFDDVIEEIAVDTQFSFNSRTVELSKNLNEKNSRGEFRYNKPNDYLSTIWTSDRNLRMESEFFYSENENVELCYCYKMNLSEYPDYIKKYIITSLAIRLAEAFDIYEKKIPNLIAEKIDIINNILTNEGLPFPIER